MEMVVLALVALGAVALVVCNLWILVNAFRVSILWGLGSLIVPAASLVFVLLHWDDNKKPFLYSLAGAAVMLAGVFLSPDLELPKQP